MTQVWKYRIKFGTCRASFIERRRTKAHVREPATKPVGKPDAGNPHVRFDERGRETGRSQRPAPAPGLDSTAGSALDIIGRPNRIPSRCREGANFTVFTKMPLLPHLVRPVKENGCGASVEPLRTDRKVLPLFSSRGTLQAEPPAQLISSADEVIASELLLRRLRPPTNFVPGLYRPGFRRRIPVN